MTTLQEQFEDSLNEECFMFRITDENFINYVADVQRRIANEGHNVVDFQDLDDLHVTIAYGVDREDYETIFKMLDPYEYIDLSLDERFTYFDTPNGQCLKIGVFSEVLQKVHAQILELGYESDFPIFEPHITIAYIAGTERPWSGALTGLHLTLTDGEFVWVDVDGEEV